MDIIGSLIYLILIIIILGAFGVIIYVAYDYYNYKKDNSLRLDTAIINTDTNKNKIQEVAINTSNMNGTFNNFFNSLANNITGDSSNLNSDKSVNYQNLSKNISNKFLSMNTMDSTIKSHTSNINTFDANLKKYFTFSNNGSNINNGLFEYYMFGNDSIKGLELINKTTAVAGMTIQTNDNNSFFEICDAANKLNCIKMKNTGTNFMISPSSTNTSNILFKGITNNSSSSVVNIDLINNATYFNGDNATLASVYINESGLYTNKPINTSSINLYNTTNKSITSNLNYDNYNKLLNSLPQTGQQPINST